MAIQSTFWLPTAGTEASSPISHWRGHGRGSPRGRAHSGRREGRATGGESRRQMTSRKPAVTRAGRACFSPGSRPPNRGPTAAAAQAARTGPLSESRRPHPPGGLVGALGTRGTGRTPFKPVGLTPRVQTWSPRPAHREVALSPTAAPRESQPHWGATSGFEPRLLWVRPPRFAAHSLRDATATQPHAWIRRHQTNGHGGTRAGVAPTERPACASPAISPSGKRSSDWAHVPGWKTTAQSRRRACQAVVVNRAQVWACHCTWHPDLGGRKQPLPGAWLPCAGTSGHGG